MIVITIGEHTKKANVSGLDQPPAEVHWRNRDYIVLKVPGHKYWSQHPPGPTHSYAPAEFQVYALKTSPEQVEGMETLEVVRVLSFPVSRLPKPSWPGKE